MDYIVVVSLFFTVIIGGGLVLAIPQINKYLKLLLAFSGAYLLAICVMHLLPEVYHSHYEYTGLFILGGFLLQLFLEYFSGGIEHGHVHVHQEKANRFPVAIMISLCIHSFFEGMPLEAEIHNHVSHSHDHSNGSLLYGILLHKLPVAIALMSLLLQSGLSKARAFLWLAVFAIMAPLGTVLGHTFGHELVAAIEPFFVIVLAVVVGMLMHIATTILFESSDGHKMNLMKFASIILGGALAFLAM